MWAGDAVRNRYFEERVIPGALRDLGIHVRLLPLSDTVEVIHKLVNEKNAGKTTGGSLDVVWINGENFRTARQADVLWGPFAAKLPNIGLYAKESRSRDFGFPIDDYEAPWQQAQFVLAYDSARVANPPATFEDLLSWAKAHPSRFTYIAPPDYTGSAFIRHLLVYFGGKAQQFSYENASASALAYLKEIRPYLWKRGETYPATVREQNALFANSEIDFAMSYSPAFASEAIARGDFPPTARTFLFTSGTLSNYSYLAIPFNTSHAAGALALINYLMSFDQVLELSRILGSPFPQELSELTPPQREAVRALPLGPATLSAEALHSHSLREPDSQYVDRFEKDWRRQVLRQ